MIGPCSFTGEAISRTPDFYDKYVRSFKGIGSIVAFHGLAVALANLLIPAALIKWRPQH